MERLQDDDDGNNNNSNNEEDVMFGQLQKYHLCTLFFTFNVDTFK